MCGDGPQPKGGIAHQGQRQGGDALRCGPDAGVAVGVAAQPVGVFQRVPGPANHGAHGQHGARDVARGVGRRVLYQGGPLHMVDAGDAQQDQHQRRGEFQPRETTVALVVEQVGRDGDDHRQCADDHGGQRPACALDGAGQKQVIQHVADGRQLECGHPIGPGEPSHLGAVNKGQGQRDETEGQIAAKGVQRGGVVGQHQRAHEHEAPHHAGSQRKEDAAPEGGRVLRHGLQKKSCQARHAGSCQLRHRARARSPTVTTTQPSSATQPGVSSDQRPT